MTSSVAYTLLFFFFFLYPPADGSLLSLLVLVIYLKLYWGCSTCCTFVFVSKSAVFGEYSHENNRCTTAAVKQVVDIYER